MSSPNPEKNANSSTKSHGIPLPDKGTLVTVILCLEITLCLRIFAAGLDHAIVNVVSLILVFVSIVSLLTWLAKKSGLPKRVRLGLPIAIVVAIALFAATHRIESTTGNLLPKFRPRWVPTVDAQLPRFEEEAKSKAAANSASNDEPAIVDLKTITENDFPEFLGPQRHPFVSGKTLAKDWNQTAPREVWRRPIGAGWAAFSVVNGFAVTMEQRGTEEWVTCYDARTGEPRWGHSIQSRHESVLGGAGPRSTPTIHDGKVYAIGATGSLVCLDGGTGKQIWGQSLFELVWQGESAANAQRKDEAIIAWGRSASPLIVDQLVIVPGGGPSDKSVSLIAFDKQSGKIVWKAGTTQIGYSSPVLLTLTGQRQIVSVNESNVTSHQVEDGKILWEHSWPGTSNADANTTQPVPLPGDRILLSKGYGGGGKLIQVSAGSDGSWKTETVWHEPRVLKTKFANVVTTNGFAYGLSDGILECVDLANGQSKWKQKKRGSFEHGQLLGVGDSLLVLGEKGELALVAADPEKFQEFGRFQALHSSSDRNWNNLCLFGNLLLIRNDEEAACFELR